MQMERQQSDVFVNQDIDTALCYATQKRQIVGKEGFKREQRWTMNDQACVGSAFLTLVVIDNG
jgi:hypothetical protein